MKKEDALKVGDFVKHKQNAKIIFQVVQILEPADENGSRLLHCVQVHDLQAYLEDDLTKYELTAADHRRITDGQNP